MSESFQNLFPQGGPNKVDSYVGTLAAFLKMQWAIYVPSRAQLGDRKPEVKIALHGAVLRV